MKNKCIKILFVVLMLASFSIIAQPVKVLFIGSSLTRNNDLPEMFRELSIAAGKDVVVEYNVIGGHDLIDHCNNDSTINKIYKEQWDYVVLENGNYQVANSANHWIIKKSVDSLSSHIFKNCATTKRIFYLDYAMKNGVNYEGVYYTFYEFQDLLYDGTMSFAENMGLIVAPIGVAWGRVYDERPDIELFWIDNGHPSVKGSYLGACVYFSVIFQEALNTNNYTGSLLVEEANYIQTVASDIVLGDADKWGIYTGIKTECKNLSELPGELTLYQNYPNPFNPSTTIDFTVPSSSKVSLKIFNLIGEQVATLVDREMEAGQHSIDFFANNLSTGLYLYRLSVGDKNIIKKMILIK